MDTVANTLRINLPSIKVMPVEPGAYFKENPIWMANEFEQFVRRTKGIDYYRPLTIFEKQSPASFTFMQLGDLLSSDDLFSEENVAAIAAGLLKVQPPRTRGALSTHSSNLLCTKRWVIDLSIEMVNWRLRFFDRRSGFFDKITYAHSTVIFSPAGL